jgi:hypothetical protein
MSTHAQICQVKHKHDEQKPFQKAFHVDLMNNSNAHINATSVKELCKRHISSYRKTKRQTPNINKPQTHKPLLSLSTTKGVLVFHIQGVIALFQTITCVCVSSRMIGSRARGHDVCNNE